MPEKADVERTGKIIKILKKHYSGARIALDFNGPFELLIATVLSAQCTDERVNIVTKGLFKKYKKPSDYVNADQGELEEDIRSTGFFRQKARNIRAACRMIEDDFGGKLPDSMEDMTRLPGVARKTANIVLGNGMGIISGIAVDTHVKRLSERLGLSKQSQQDKIEADLMELVAKKDWLQFSHLLQAHGRTLCKARKPNCPDCPLSKLCPSSTV